MFNPKKLSLLNRCLLSCFAIGAMFLLSSVPATAQKLKSHEYRKIIKEALKEFDIGNYDEACSLFRRAHSVNPNARTLRGLGMASFEARRYVDAITALQASIDDKRKGLTKKQRREVKKLLKRAEGLVGYIEIQLEPASATFTIDSQEPVFYKERVLADPGDRQLVASAEGYVTSTRQISVRGGSTERVVISLESMKSATSIPPGEETEPHDKAVKSISASEASGGDGDLLPWFVLGGSGVAMITGGILLALALNDISNVEDAKEATPWKDIEPSDERVPVLSTVGFILLGVGTAGVATGIVLLASDDQESQESVSIRLRPNGISMSGTL